MESTKKEKKISQKCGQKFLGVFLIIEERGRGDVRECKRKKYKPAKEKINVTIMCRNRYAYSDAKSGKDVYRVCLPYSFVSDQLSDEISGWDSETSVFIAADTGLGKNTFVEKNLIPKVRESCGKILLLSNRVALGRQEKRRLARIFSMEEVLDDYTDKGLDKLIKFGCLTVVSYQQLGAWINEKSAELDNITENFFDYIVVDEAHFFLADCSFNPLTDKILSFIVNNFQDSVRIYMTATPEQIFPVLREKQGYVSPYRRNWILYEFAHDFSWIQPKAFAGLNDLADIVQQKDEKWLIFVNSISMGNELKSLIGEGTLLTAESKNPEDPTYPIFSQIVKREKYDERVVIATSVLENGINIKDPKLKNVAIFSNEKMQFMQMLGRVRRMAGGVTLYIPDVNSEQLLKHLQRVYAIDQAVEILKKDATKFYQEYLLPENPPVKIKSAVTLLKSGMVHVNSLLGLKTLVFDYPFCYEMYERSKSGEEFIMLKEKFSWLEQDFQVEDFVSRKEFDEGYEKLISFLEQRVGILIPPKEKNDFSSEFSMLFKKIYGMRNEDKNQNQIYGLNIMKKLIDERNLPFAVKSDKDGWMVERREIK